MFAFIYNLLVVLDTLIKYTNKRLLQLKIKNTSSLGRLACIV